MIQRLSFPFLIVAVLSAAACQWVQFEDELQVRESPAWLAGGFGSEAGQFHELGPGTIDDQGRILIADNTLKRLTWFDSEGNVLQVRTYGGEPGPPLIPDVELENILALAFQAEELYIATRRTVWTVRDQQSHPIEVAALPGPLRAMAVDGERRIHMLTPDQVSILDRTGRPLSTVTIPEDPAPDCRGLALDADGNIYVSARGLRQVLVFDAQGTELRRIGSRGDGPGQFAGGIRGIGVDRRGNVFVQDDGDNAVEIFDPEGKSIGRLGSKGSAPGQTLSVQEILSDTRRDRLALLDGINRRVQVFDLTGEDVQARDLTSYTAELQPTPIPDHIALGIGDDPAKERKVTWRTDRTVSDSRAQLVESDLSQVGRIEWSSDSVQEFRGESVEFYGNLGPYRAHETTVDGLSAGTHYVYRVGTEGAWSAPRYFQLPRDPQERLTVVVLGDSRNRMDVWGQIVNTSAKEDPAFIINTGDLVRNGDDMADWNAWFHEARLVFDRIPLMPCLGNHERQSPNYFLAFALPDNGPDGLKEEAYSFDFGSAHWVVLNTENDLDIQARWLEEDLKENRKPWTFVLFHRPAYAGHPSRGDGNIDVRNAWSGILEEYGVDIAWQGHDHYYFRTKPIRNAEVVAPGEGPVYVTTGGAGAPLYPIELNPYAETAESVDHFCVVDLTPERCQVRVYRADGSTLDEFTLAPRSPDAPVPPVD